MILVLGHRNPDMDAIAAAIGYAWVLNQQQPEQPYVAGRAGDLNAQTSYALERFQVKPPELVHDLYRRMRDVLEEVAPVRDDHKLRDCISLIAQRPLPVVDQKMQPLGLLTPGHVLAYLSASLLESSELAQRLDISVRDIMDKPGRLLSQFDSIAEVLPALLRGEQDDFIVTASNGNYVGMCRKAALLHPPVPQLILVDHNEAAQAVAGIEQAEIIEILDHHRLGGLATSLPTRIQIEAIGSTSTLVFERAAALGVALIPPIAGILLGGILSDTMLFRSPTTTPRDIAAAEKLAQIAGIEIKALGEALLAAGAGLENRPAEAIINADSKLYRLNCSQQIKIGQVEVTGFDELKLRQTDLQAALAEQIKQENLALAVLLITDIVTGNSRLIAAGDSLVLSSLPFVRLPDGTYYAPGIVSRKKQLAPALLTIANALLC